MTDPRDTVFRTCIGAALLVLALGCVPGAVGRGHAQSASGAPAWDPALLRRVEGTSTPAAPGGARFALDGIPLRPGRGSDEARFAPGDAGGWLPALLEFAGPPTDLGSLGFVEMGGTPGLRAVLGPPEAFARFRDAPGALRQALLARPLVASLDRSLPGLGMATVRSGVGPTWVGPTGRGVLIGIVDTGLDIHHPDFRRPDGTTRVLAYWDQTVSHTSMDVPIGALYREPLLNHFLLSASVRGLDFDSNGHGTHVAGIAGGDGSAGGAGRPFTYVGVAPDAEFVIVKSYFNEASVVGAVEFIFREADRLGRPAVINLSLGHQYGPHDGTGLFERLLSEMCGPGHLLVVAAGNEGAEGIHAFLPGGAGSDSISFRVPPVPNPGDLVNVVGLSAWGPADLPSRFTLVFPDGRRVGPFAPGADRVLHTGDYSLNADQTRFDFGRNFNLDLRLFSPQWPTGTFQIVVEPADRGTRAPQHFWLPYFDLNGPGVPAFVRGRDERATLSEPANAFNVLSVAATVSRNCWVSAARPDSVCSEPRGRPGDLVFYSSVGPTPDGRPKPEVAAPGEGIASALSGAMSPETAAARNLPLRLMPDSLHWVSSGTSMAAPHLAGALALLLERVPALSPDVARERLRRTNVPIDAPAGTFVGGRLALIPFLESAARPGRASIAAVEGRRVRIEWEPVPTPGVDPIFRVARGMSVDGPFDVVGRADGPLPAAGPRIFEDGPLEPGRRYYYRLSVVDVSGLDAPLDTLDVTVPGMTGLALAGPRVNPGPLPLQFEFFLPETSAPTVYRLEIFDVQGRRLAEPTRGTWGPQAEVRPFSWDGAIRDRRRVPAGLYLVRLTAGAGSRSVKVVVRG